MKIYLDMDGVLVDWLGGVERLHNISLTPYPCPGSWHCIEYLGLNTPEFWNKLDREFYANLHWTEDGHKILATCINAVGKENICFCTSCTLQGGCAAGKIDWLQREIPELSRNYAIVPHKHFCSGPNRILIDDGDHNILEWNGPSILIPRIWNSGYKNLDYNLKELLNEFCS